MSTAPPIPAEHPAPFDDALVAALVAACVGPVHLPGEDADLEGSGFNVAVRHTPRIVVGATCVQDVQHAVRFAAETGATITVQATGHGIGWPAEGVLVTTGRMDSVTVDPVTRTARAGAGATWEQVIEAAVPHGLAPLNGSSVDVGVVGYTVGGGVGPLARTFGAACDRVRSFEVVTADGNARRVDHVSDPDLFFALRGGKGNFGIVTAVTFELVELAEIYGGGIFFDGADAPAVLHAYQDWIGDLTDSTTTSIALLNLPPLPELPPMLQGKFVVHLRMAHVGDHAEGERLAARMRGVATPLLDHLGVLPYAAIASIHQDPRDPMPGLDRGGALSELTPETIDALLAVAGPGSELPLIMVELRQLGGALDEKPASPRAFDLHGAKFGVLTIGLMIPPLVDLVPAASERVYDALAPWTVATCMPNFIGGAPSAEAVRLAYGDATFEKLCAIKAAVDPDDLFRTSHPLTQAYAGRTAL